MNLSTTGLRLAADSGIDLHLHTTCSDGTWTPEQLIDYLAQAQYPAELCRGLLERAGIQIG